MTLSSSMRWLLMIAVLCPAMSWCHLLQAQDAATPDSDQIAKLIDQLGSSAFEEREAAQKSLRQIGQPAYDELDKARNHKSPEVRSRAAMLLKQLDLVPLKAAFETFAKQPDEKLSLEEGMWLISRILNRGVQRASLDKKLDSLANSVRKKLGENVSPRMTDPERVVAALCEVLFVDEGFDGNEADYQNPDNSSLERVLQKKKGLPILLSHMTVAVGRRLEVPIVGLPAPGRYLVKYDGKQAPPGFARKDIFIDPYGHGRVLSLEDRQEVFPGINLDRLMPQSPRDDLIRMLNNIETHLFGRDEVDKAYLSVEFKVALQDHAPAKKE